MKHRTADLEGALLDAAVAKADAENYAGVVTYRAYSTRWDEGGPIIERERINLVCDQYGATSATEWEAYAGPLDPNRLDMDPATGSGPTPLIAAMRAYVASKFGDEVELPD